MIDNTRDNGSRQRRTLACAQRDEELRRIEYDGVYPRPLQAQINGTRQPYASECSSA